VSVADRVVVIAGATGVLGPVVAREFAANGAGIALLARSRDELQAVLATLAGGAERHLAVPVDLASAEDAARAAQLVRERLGRTEILLHLVGTYRGGSGLAQTPASDWELLLEVNLRSATHALSAFIAQLADGDYGRVVAVSTPFAQQPGATNAAYAASKAALEALTLSVAREGCEHGVTANVLVVRSIRSEPPADGEDSRPRTWTRPEELAATMLWLCSDEAAMITGARIPLHGGTAP
jgi:NAD(P)-dependent dehydrogenase (short-subunit alcohol dehydrogenase family)